MTKTVYDLLKITKGGFLSPKEFDSAMQLLQIVDLTRAEEIWRMKYKDRYPFSLMDGIKIAKVERARHPERVFERPNRTTEPYTCEECALVPNSPVTPMEEVIKVLGYIDKTF